MSRFIIAGEVRTGRRITHIPVADAQWSTSLGAGDIRVTIPLRATDFAPLRRQYVGGLFPGEDVFPSESTWPQEAKPVWRPFDGLRAEFLAALEPVRCFLAVIETSRDVTAVLQAGPIQSWRYDSATGRLVVGATDIGALFQRRLVLDAAASDYAAWAATYAGVGRGTIAKRLVQLATSHVHGALPINLPADEPGSNTRTYKGHDLAPVSQRLDELSRSEGGPEVTFRPRLSDDRLGVEWDMLTGTETAPLLVQRGPDWQWRLGLPDGPVERVELTRDASRVTNETFGADSGMDESRTIVRQQPADAGVPDMRDVGFPLLQSTVERQGDSEDGTIAPSTLRQWARAELKGHTRPHTQVTLTVRADGPPPLGAYWPGDWAMVDPGGDPLLSLMWGQKHRARIAQIAGDLSPRVQVGLLPQVEVR